MFYITYHNQTVMHFVICSILPDPARASFSQRKKHLRSRAEYEVSLCVCVTGENWQFSKDQIAETKWWACVADVFNSTQIRMDSRKLLGKSFPVHMQLCWPGCNNVFCCLERSRVPSRPSLVWTKILPVSVNVSLILTVKTSHTQDEVTFYTWLFRIKTF